jgi:hypothetical protein
MHVAQGRGQWQALVNMVMNLWVLSDYQLFKKDCSMKLVMEPSCSITAGNLLKRLITICSSKISRWS